MLKLFSDENCVRYIIPLAFLALFVFSAMFALSGITIYPAGAAELAAAGETLPEPVAYISINPLWVGLGILLIIMFVLTILFFAGVDTVAVYTQGGDN